MTLAPDASERWVNLALINAGEAVRQIGNVLQRTHEPGPAFAEAKLALLRAVAALDGVAYVPPPDAKG